MCSPTPSFTSPIKQAYTAAEQTLNVVSLRSNYEISTGTYIATTIDQSSEPKVFSMTALTYNRARTTTHANAVVAPVIARIALP